MAQPFPKAVDLKLLKLVKDNPLLYNPRNSKYSDCDSREVTWQKIGDALNRPARRCKSRWLNIRDQMRRTFRNRRNYPDQYQRKYRYEDQLQFMRPYFRLGGNNDADYSEYLDDDDSEINAFEDDLDEPVRDIEKVDVKPNLRKKDATSTVEIDIIKELDPSDALDVFLMTVGSTLRKFNPYYLNQAKSKIFQICQDYELQQIMNREANQVPASSDGNS